MPAMYKLELSGLMILYFLMLLIIAAFEGG